MPSAVFYRNSLTLSGKEAGLKQPKAVERVAEFRYVLNPPHSSGEESLSSVTALPLHLAGFSVILSLLFGVY
jgi:hypothetical protein